MTGSCKCIIFPFASIGFYETLYPTSIQTPYSIHEEIECTAHDEHCSQVFKPKPKLLIIWQQVGGVALMTAPNVAAGETQNDKVKREGSGRIMI